NYIQSKSRGTGSTLPLGFYIDATKYIELGTDGTTTFSGPVQVENGTIIRDWDSGDTDIDGLISGSTFGSLIQGRNTGHLTLGIRDNGADDSFSVLSGSGNYSTDTTYDKICFKVDADGTTTLGGSTTLGGNLDLQSNNIIGDFSNGTLANRVYFQTSTADSSTSLSVLPSGTNNASTYLSFNDSDYDNAGYLATGINATEGYISANKTGSGTLLPLRFHAGGVWRAQLETDGTLSVDPTLNYETLVTADDDIPNKKYVDDAVVGITDVVQDTTPQAGGDFDLQSFDLIGDFGLATAPASRSAFKTNATNDSTVFHVVPNGTGNSSYLSLENNEARANSEALVIACTSTKHQINAGTRGTGSLLPIELQMQGVPCLTVNTNFGLTVTTGTAYETLVTTDDHIPNRKYVLDNSINNVVEDTTPQLGGDLNTNGNDIIFGAGDNIIGDFSNATSDSRTGFQNSNTNASTVLHARPNGTGTASYSIFQNQPAFVGCEYATFGHFGSVAVCGSYSQSGTTANPLELRIESDAALTINTDLSATFADNVEILGESIIGDMSNANPDLRLGFQNSVANSSTVPHVRPSGTATSAYMIFQNQAAFSGCEYVAFGHYGSAAVIASNSQSGLSASPIQFQIEGVNKFELETDGTLNVAGTTNYETLVTADDDIPNKKYVDDNSINNVVEDTTPQLGGDLDIQANNIVGDFGAAAGSRPAFKSSTTNAITAVTAYPNGTGGQSYFVAESDDSANNEIVSLGVTSSVTAINSSKRGTGTTKAFQIQIDSNAALEVETNGTLNVSGTTNYETLVTSDDDIPNKKYVDDVLGKDLGEFTVANLPAASSNANYYALATNASGGRTVVRSDGTNWKVIAVEGATVTT
ncbi:MAG: hypothetical protein KJO69_07840, partial [Gammaproteobacteria bacterium]|nr:hypothetical protein [Gammaproteobacteria bacterium]